MPIKTIQTCKLMPNLHFPFPHLILLRSGSMRYSKELVTYKCPVNWSLQALSYSIVYIEHLART